MSYLKGPDLNVALPDFNGETSVLKKIHQYLVRNGDNLAMVEGWCGQQISFKELLRQSVMVAAGLRRLGVAGGDRVLFCCDKSILSFVVLLGTHFVGATAVLFPVLYTDTLVDLILGQVKIVFTDPEHFERLAKLIARMKVQPLLVATLDRNDKSLQSLMRPADDFEVFGVKDPRTHVVLISFSSGTTGVPKAIQITDSFLQFVGLNFQYTYKSILTATPFYWLSSEVFFMSSICWNYTVVFNTPSDASTSLELIQKYQIEGLFAGVGAMVKYKNEPKLKEFDLSSVKKVIAAGEPILSCSFKDFSSNVLGGNASLDIIYGSSEVGIATIYSTNKYHDREFPTGAGGEPYPGVEIKVVDEQGSLVPVGSLGEVCINTPARSIGYWAKPELNKEAFDSEGFFKTGDAGFCDSQGLLHLRGRYSDLITFRGIKLSSLDLEDLLMSHPGVMDVAVVGRPHVTDIQHLTAFVVKVLGSDVTAQELHNFVDNKVNDEQKLRGGVHFVEELPRVSIGKVQRKLLREMSLTKTV